MTMAAFDAYAGWYDLFNADKDYDGEISYLLRKIALWNETPRHWLDVGCGTGRHLGHVAARGIAVEGLDGSTRMIERARSANPGIPLHVGDAQDLQVPERWDVVSMLFHVINYLTTDEAVCRTMNGIARTLEDNGVFVFDFWNSDAVLHEPPGSRVRSTLIDGRRLFRISTPSEDKARHRIDVRFQFRWDSTDGEIAHEEVHALRHFSASELTEWLEQAGMRVRLCEGWKTDRPLSQDDWYGLICAARE